MELELRPRRSPFETGNTKASLATPSCCCCCCCLNALGAASGIIGADTKARALDAGRSDNAARWFGILGFLFTPMFLLALWGIFSLIPRLNNGWTLVGLVVVAFVIAHTGLRALANSKDALSVHGFAMSILAILVFALVSAVEALLTTLTFGVALLASPISAMAGWEFGTSKQEEEEEEEATEAEYAVRGSETDQGPAAPSPAKPAATPLAEDPEQTE